MGEGGDVTGHEDGRDFGLALIMRIVEKTHDEWICVDVLMDSEKSSYASMSSR
jgi:hypothetical protein